MRPVARSVSFHDRQREPPFAASFFSSLIALLLLVGVPCDLLGDTIVLKNGRRIYAEAVSEEGSTIFYEGAAGQVAIPKSLVERVEKGGVAPASRSSSRIPSAAEEEFSKDLARGLEPPGGDEEGVVREGAVDEERLRLLADIAGKGDLERQNAVNAHLIAASFEARQQRLASAGRWAEEALRLSPRTLNALLLSAQIDIARQKYSEAVEHLLVAQSVAADSPDVLTLLGYAYYFSDGPEKALRSWKQAVRLRPDEKLEQRIRQVEKEAQVEGGFAQAESGHFVLSSEGSEVSPPFGREILAALEQDYRELESALDYSPREALTVILYASQQFADITRAPGWVGALNDGKIRIPVQGLSSLTPDLSRVLKHELVHSFVFRLTEGRCPTWLNEGLAQMESGESASGYGSNLARLYAQSGQLPLAGLEGPFMGFDASRAALAYAESLAAVEMIRNQYGAYRIPQILKLLGQGLAPEAALRQALRTGYADLETELADYLAGRYGR